MWRGLCALLALIVPTLVGYDVYFQFRTPGTDFGFDHSGLVHEVPFASYADWAGMHPGDVIQTVDGTPFLEWLDGSWHDLSQGPYMMQVERRGQLHTIEIPAIPLVKMNARSLVSATLAALTFWGIGILLLLRRFQQQEIRIVYTLSQVFAVLLLFPLAHPAPYLAPGWGLMLSSASLYVAAPLLLHYYLTFPVVLGTPGQRRWWLGAIYGLALTSLVLRRIHSPWRRWGTACIVLQVVVAVAVLIYVYARRAPPDGRRRLRLVVLGNIAAALPGVLFYILPQMFQAGPYIPEWLVALCLVIAPSSYLYATLRHSLFGIDRFLNRALVYALLSIGILTLYLGPFLLIYHFAPGDPLAQMMIAAGLTLLIGLAFERSRTQAQRLVDRLFYGGWYDYPGVVETISEALARSIERRQMADVLTRQVPALMQLRGAHLWIGEPDETEPGNVPQPQLRFAFNFQGQRQGLWIVGPRRDGEDLTAPDRRILQTLARQAEIALSNVLLVETLRHQLDEIRASRETLAQTQHQLLRSREEERARLARDLHDGPIQALVGLNLQLGLLLAPADGQDLPQRGELQTMRGEVRELLTELRQVCAELRPPMLDTLGLGAALRALAGDWSAQCGVAVSLNLPSDATLRPLPDVVTVNLYRVVQEALSNVARHAAARSVTIQLAWDDPRLSLTLCDDGQGFVVPPTFHDLTAQGHFGLVGMQERLDLIDGAWTVESAPGRGTTVRVVWQKR
jgi:signal transduction histidine kinase